MMASRVGSFSRRSGALALCVFVPAPAYAAIDWVGGLSGQWGDSVNWSPATVPDSSSAEATITNVATGTNQNVVIDLAGSSFDLLSLEATSTTAFPNTRVRVQNGTLNFATGATLRFNGNDQPNQELDIDVTLVFTDLTIDSFRADRFGRQRSKWSLGIDVDAVELQGSTLDIDAGSVLISGGNAGVGTITLDPSAGNIALDDTDLSGVDLVLMGAQPSDVNDRSGVSGTNVIESLTINGAFVQPGTYVDGSTIANLVGGGTVDLSDFINFSVIGGQGDRSLTVNSVVPEPGAFALLTLGGVCLLSRSGREGDRSA